MTKKLDSEVVDGFIIDMPDTEPSETEFTLDDLEDLDPAAFDPSQIIGDDGPGFDPRVPNEKVDPYKTSKGGKKAFSRMNISKKMYQMRCHPVETLAMISNMDDQGLNMQPGKTVSVREAIDASKILLSYVAAPLKPQEAPAEEEAYDPVLTYIPKRAIPEDFVASLPKPEDDEYDEEEDY